MKTRFGSRHLICCVFLAVALLLTACGRVVTPQPTATAPPPVYTPTPTSRVRITATAPLLPPADTATPTIAPTPIVHVVQDGETLLGIALDYGVSLEALQAANGIEDPRFLQVGQRLTIPTGQEAVGGAPGLLLPTPTPMPFGVRGLALYETPVGSLWCLGEIVNTTNVALTNVQVRVTLYDAAGQPLAAADVFAAADFVLPGERAPFGVLFTSPPAGWASPQVAIVRGEAAGALTDLYVPIALSEVTGQPSGPQFQVSGVAQNASTTGQAAASLSIVATTYDAQGLVTGFRQESLPLEGPVAPGVTVPFTVLFGFHGDAPADFHVVALGRTSTE
jgi:LysM repeat protein